MAGSGAVDEAEGAFVHEAMEGEADGGVREAGAGGEPGDGKADARLAFEKGVAEEMGVDGAIDVVEAESGDENVLELLPEKCAVEWFVVHS